MYADAVAALGELASGKVPQTDNELGILLGRVTPYYFSNPEKYASCMTDDMSGDLPSVYAFQTNANDAKPEYKIPQVAEASKILARTLIMSGDEDAMCSKEGSEALASGISMSKLYVMKGAGHFPYYEKPDEFWSVVNEFLGV